MDDIAHWWLGSTQRVGLLVLVTFSVLGWLVRDAYPFSTYAMFAHDHRVASRLVAVDAAGEAHGLAEVSRWRCAGPVPAQTNRCGARRVPVTGYLDAEDLRRLPAQAAAPQDPPGEPLTLARRVWTIEHDGSVTITDCPVLQCTGRVAPAPRS